MKTCLKIKKKIHKKKRKLEAHNFQTQCEVKKIYLKIFDVCIKLRNYICYSSFMSKYDTFIFNAIRPLTTS